MEHEPADQCPSTSRQISKSAHKIDSTRCGPRSLQIEKHHVGLGRQLKLAAQLLSKSRGCLGSSDEGGAARNDAAHTGATEALGQTELDAVAAAADAIEPARAVEVHVEGRVPGAGRDHDGLPISAREAWRCRSGMGGLSRLTGRVGQS